jgi:L-alanine-DL-glutamate epimerase-like enolase superfamily enzyme
MNPGQRWPGGALSAAGGYRRGDARTAASGGRRRRAGKFIHPLPICADESCHTRDSLPQLRGRYEMVNIKLDKTGG